MLNKILSRVKQSFCNPRLFLKNVQAVIFDIKTYYFPQKNVQRFIAHNIKIWESWKAKDGKNIILFDYFPLAETEIPRSYLLNILADKHNAKIVSYSFNNVRRNHWKKIYNSFNVVEHIVVELNESQKEKSGELFKEIMSKIENKRDVFELNILGVWVGVDIYEEYLMRYTEPTFILEDPRAEKIILEGIEAVIFWKEFFESNNVKAVVSSHIGVRIARNLPCKIAGQLFNIPFYSTHARSITHFSQPHLYYKEFPKHYRGYPLIFKTLPDDVQKKGMEWARDQLKRRFSGEVGVGMSYSTKSAFASAKKTNPVLQKNEKIKVLICSHEFYDSPNCYGGLIFPDFYEWMIFLGKISEKTDYDWYIKTHPDVLPKSKEVIDSFVKKYNRITLVPPETSHLQLAEEGIKFVLTCYGTVGHEYPLLDVQVINAGNNPHMGYDFNWHPKTVDEYEQILLNFGNIKKAINPNDVYEFYYMHHKKQGTIDDWVYASYKGLLSDLTEKERFGPDIFPYFLKQLNSDKHQEIIAKFTKYIDSGKIGSAIRSDFVK